MSGFGYRPICDTWILARPKGGRLYGAFPAGFYWRMRAMLPGTLCHLCSGTLGQEVDNNAVFVDLNAPEDIIQRRLASGGDGNFYQCDARRTPFPDGRFDAVMIDPPYSPEDSQHYGVEYPDPKDLLLEAWRLVRPGGRIGFLHYLFPRPPKNGARLIAAISVLMGFGNRVRLFTVFEKSGGETR